MPEEVQSTDQQIPAKEAPKNIPHKINWLHVLIGVVIGVVLLGVGFGVYFLTQSKSDSTNESIKVSTPSVKQTIPSADTATPSADKDETADWKVYTDSKIGFTVKYPKDWLSGVCEEKTLFLAPTKETLGLCQSEFGGMVQISSINQTYQDYINLEGFKDVSYLNNGLRQETTVSGREAVKISGTYKKTEGYVKKDAQKITYLINHSGKVFSLNYYSEPGWGNHSETFEKIVSTFKFLD